jgi:NAD(P)-dependent dehydrogenase (short-subunit alcohol dehydrogenase family)
MLVLGATGPVGQRVVLLLARQGARVRVGSRQADRASQICERIKGRIPEAKLEPVAAGDPGSVQQALQGQTAVVAAGAAGAVFIPKAAWGQVPASLKVLVDLNAVPPLGIEAIEVGDKAKERDGKLCYGAIGVGGTKMKIHRAAVAKLFESNNLVLDAEEVYQLGEAI